MRKSGKTWELNLIKNKIKFDEKNRTKVEDIW
jgi:hypothetical protein